MSAPDVIKADFYAIKRAWRIYEAPYRYMTEAYFPDTETLERAFCASAYQGELTKSLVRIDPLFLMSEDVVSEVSV